MKANKLLKFLLKIEKDIKVYNRTLKDVKLNFRFSDNSDVYRVKNVEEDLFDSTTNNILESIIFKIK
jgi:hypothetical protein